VRPAGELAVGLTVRGRSLVAKLANPGMPPVAHESLTVPANCLTQLFTATLVLIAVSEGKLTLQDEISQILSARESRHPHRWRGITVRTLLNYTHGLDGSSVYEALRDTKEHTNPDALVDHLNSITPLGAPGLLYTYNPVGPLLAAAALETLYDRPFENLLEAKLFNPLGIVLRKEAGHTGCISPATGDGLVVSTQDLLTFLNWHLADDHQHAMSDMYQDTVEVPGLNQERRAGLGWRYYGNNCFGHVGTSAPHSAIARLNIREQLAVVITGNHCMRSSLH
jgi:CubicO group peptidase (beta-lactamase class C family)